MPSRGRPSNKAREEEIARALGPERVPENQKREIYERVRRAVEAKNGGCSSHTVGSSPWDKHEQKVLEDGLRYYPHDKHSNMGIYIRIAASLPKKTVRDVAHHLRQMQDAHRAKLEAAAGMNPTKRHHPDPAAAAAMAAMHEHQMAAMFAANAASMAPMHALPGLAQAPPVPEGPGPHLKDEKVEARVNALLRENMGLLGSIRENIMMGRFFNNHPLMISFDKNIKELTALLAALPLADVHTLPVQINPYFITGAVPAGVGPPQPAGSPPHHPHAPHGFAAWGGGVHSGNRNGQGTISGAVCNVGGSTTTTPLQIPPQQQPQSWSFVPPASQPLQPQVVPHAAKVVAASKTTVSAADAAIADVQPPADMEVAATPGVGEVMAQGSVGPEIASTAPTKPAEDPRDVAGEGCKGEGGGKGSSPPAG
ncbi:unnamed protein product [Ascophyllum nodosum]